jgi:hypothetical protein
MLPPLKRRSSASVDMHINVVVLRNIMLSKNLFQYRQQGIFNKIS